MTMYKDFNDRNRFYRINDITQRRVFKVGHMFSAIKINGGYLVRLHTSAKETYITKDIVFKNEPGDSIIRNSNPFFYMDDATFNNYTKTSYCVEDFPKNFKHDSRDNIKKSLEKNLINGYNKLLSGNYSLFDNPTKIIDEGRLVSFGPNKSEILVKNLDLEEISKYNEERNKVMLCSYLGIYPKNLSKIFISNERISIEEFEKVHKKIISEEGIGSELTSNWIGW